MIIDVVLKNDKHIPLIFLLCFILECRVLGAILIVIGLYSVLWGKHKEKQEEERLKQLEIIPEVVKGVQENGNHVITGASKNNLGDDIEMNGGELQKAEANKLSAVVITVPTKAPQMMPKE